jgi:uncharacterized protein
MKVVIDTNVFISGIFFTGPPYRILKAWQDGKIEILLSHEIFDEYHRVGNELAYKFPKTDLTRIFEYLLIHAEFIIVQKLPVQICDDPDDDKFIACAIAGKSNLIVSGDKHLLKISGYEGINVLTPRIFVDKFL